jgi:hypothetical protein
MARLSKPQTGSTPPTNEEMIRKITEVLEEHERHSLAPERKSYLMGKLYSLTQKKKKTLRMEGGSTDVDHH